MQFLRHSMAIGSALIALSAHAQSTNFEGVQLSIGLSAGSMTLKNTDITNNQFQNEGKSYGIPKIGASYGYKLNENFVLTTSLAYDLGSATINETLDNAQRSEKQKNHWSFSIEPGYLINEKTMVYGKISHHSMKIDYKRNFLSGNLAGQTAAASSSHTGHGIGIGLKTMIATNLGVGFEIEKVNYKDKRPLFIRSGGTTTDTISYDPSTVISTVSLFYKF